MSGVYLSEEEKQLLSTISVGDIFAFRGERYLYAERLQNPAEWLCLAETAKKRHTALN